MRFAPLLLLSFVAAACTASIMAVRDRPSANHWSALAEAEGRLNSVKQEVQGKHLKPSSRDSARQLACIYRQQGKLEEAGAIYRLLWIESDEPTEFVRDGRELAAIYLDMAGFASSIECYRRLLDYDLARMSPDDPEIALDLNNLGICYLTAGSCSPDKKNAEQYYILAGRCFAGADQIDRAKNNSALPGRSASAFNKEILSQRQAEAQDSM